MTIAELRTRVAEATGADRELDAAITAWLNNASVRRYPPSDDFGPNNRWQFWSADGRHFLGSEAKYPVPAYTGSVDDALALVEQKLPGWAWGVSGATKPVCDALLYEPTRLGFRQKIKASGKTPPLAILSALLSALAESDRTEKAV